MNKEDLKADVKMYFEQITNLCDLILTSGDFKLATVLTLRELSENGFDKANLL